MLYVRPLWKHKEDLKDPTEKGELEQKKKAQV